MISFSFIWEVICEISPELSERLEFIDDVKERKFDAVIATGSDNSQNILNIISEIYLEL